jgi:hypothetical protein
VQLIDIHLSASKMCVSARLFFASFFLSLSQKSTIEQVNILSKPKENIDANNS